jgi:PAS domain S-box-containing protein
MGGLNRYDGFSLKVYSAGDTNTPAISNSRIRTIFTDRKGVMWVGTLGGGLNKFDRKTEQFHHYKHTPKDPTSLGNDYVQTIVEDASGMLWVGTGGGLDLFNPETGVFKHFTSSREVNGIVADETGNLWIASNDGLMMYLDRESQAITWFSSATGRVNSTYGPLAVALFFDSDGVLWVYDNKFGLTQISRENQRKLLTLSLKERALLLERLSLENNIPGVGYAFAVNEDNEGALWIGSSTGLHILEKKTGRVKKIGGIPGDELSLSGGILSIFRDRSGSIWLGTNGFGCQKLNRTRQKFGLINSNSIDSNSLRSESIRSIYEDKDGAVWIGGYGGLDKLDRPSGIITHVLQPFGFDEDYFWTLYEDPTGKGDIFWFGTESGGLGTFNRRTNSWVVYHHDTIKKGSLRFGQVRAVYRDRTGILWVCTQQEGLIRFDDRAEKFKSYLHDESDSQSISSDQTNTIYQTSQHPSLLWVGTNFGLSALDLATERFTSFLSDPKNPKSISSNSINCLYQDRAGRFWIGTEGGLNLVVFPSDARMLFSNSDSVTFIHYTEAHGLPNNFIYGILEDDDGNLWLSTNKGISRFNPETETFRNFDLSDGLQSNEFNRNAYYKSRQGELFFGGIKGLNHFFPGQLKDNSYIPPVVITDFRIFNESVSPNRVPMKGGSAKSIGARSVWPLQKDITETNEIMLSYADKVFSFAFVALDYSAPGKNRFEYIMEGFDDHWIHAGTKREVTYTNLDPGEYTFRVKGSNNDGVWNEEGTSLRITIVPPYWQTWWFRMASVIALFALAFIGYHIKINSMREKNIVLQKEVIARKRSEEARRQAEENFRRSIDESPLGIRIVSPQGETLYANRAILDIYGYKDIEELKSAPLKHRYTQESYAEYQLRKKKRMNGEDDASEYPISIIRKTGEILHLWVFNKDIMWNGQKQFQAIYQDITEQKRAEEKLRETLSGLRNALGGIIQVLSATTEKRDPYTAGHQRRVADLARAIGQEMGLAADRVEGLRTGGSIHDIGKVSIPAEILSKPTRLTEIEYKLIQTHSQAGYEILRDIDFSWPLAEMVFQHHERMNGSGYPQGLKGEDILLEARILAVSDVVEAMASHRPYRPALGIAAALEEIEKDKGILYDPDVVSACLTLFREKGFTLKQ